MRRAICTCGLLLLFAVSSLGQGPAIRQQTFSCDDPTGIFCAEAYDFVGYNGAYTGHDEPSVLFYSGAPGSGNTMVYLMQLPKDPPTLPNQSGTGGTFNFQLHPAFWVGMAMCDDQSAPNPGGSSVGPNVPCTPDSDSNIYDSQNSSASDYIGLHPGTAFMEMQFYPPGWVTSCDTTNRWCSALTIDSLSENMNTGVGNNSACGGVVEYVNFAFITKSGVPGGPPSPLLQNNSTFTTTADTLFYNPGDVLRIVLQDTTHGLKITITDLTSGESGSMTASAANGFAGILYDPKGHNCKPSTHNIPTDFHPMYATSSEHTRVPWAAHSYNIAFSDEIGHFEYCNAVSSEGGSCTEDGVHDLDSALPAGTEDDFGCFDAAFASGFNLVPIGGCTSSDVDFDGVPYQQVWPGTLKSQSADTQLHAAPVLFTSPLLINTNTLRQQNFDRVAFETDLPRVESNTSPPCQRHVSNPNDPNPGSGCVNPPSGANFYPFFTTGGGSNCTWQEGGANIPGTKKSFGGSSTAEFGSLLTLAYPAATPPGSVSIRYNDFRQVLSSNPCPASGSIAAR
ncbi:MAG TPA: hypothetical protein VJP04_04035 [Terriglobales bacterium]|nr:hypothetical protein [Terriglobales bacterium]